MDFWKVYQNARASADFGQQRLYLRARDRIHASLSAVESCATGLETSRGLFTKYSDSARYVLAEGLTYDLLVSLYDVNSSSALLMRISSPIRGKDLSEIRRRLGRLGRPNLEMRAIGLQSGDRALLDTIEKIHGLAKCNLQEVDLFGDGARHLAFDLKVGMPLDLLLLNRIYRPEELASGLDAEGFGALRSELKFV
jgi:hypothetical protein